MIKSFCKINLSLRVLSKLKSGFHNIQSNSFLINLHDNIKIKKINKKKDSVIFTGPFKKMVNPHKNSITETLSILRDKKLIKNSIKYKVIVKKNIPVFSGLGGSSSNSSFLLKYLLKRKINKFDVLNLESSVGSDLKLFIYNQCFQKSLNKVINYKKKYNFYFLLVYPYLYCSTKEIYSKVKKYSSPSKKNYAQINSKKLFIKMMIDEKNDLQNIACDKFSKLEKILDEISKQKGCLISRMTGSGSVCFGMFQSRRLASLGMKSLKKKFPRYWCVTTKTI